MNFDPNVFLQLLESMMGHQQQRLEQMARNIDPRLTAEDLLQAHDISSLRNNSDFHYEDGVLAGLRTAHMALWRELNTHKD